MIEMSKVPFVTRRDFLIATGTTAAGGQGTVSGSVTGDQVTFTITRDNRDFVWNGTRTDAGRTLSGQFDGFSNDATYRR